MVSFVSRRGFCAFAMGVLASLTLGAQALAQSIQYVVYRPSNSQFYEVIEGSGTGGRFVNAPRKIGNLHVSGYTDRAKRGEFVWVYVGGGGIAQYAGVRSDNNRLFRIAYHVPVPNWVFARVPLDPHVDNVRSFVKLPHRNEVSRRLPIGTRP